MYLHIRDQVACVPQGQPLLGSEDQVLFQTLRQLVPPKTAKKVIARVGIAGIRTLSVAALESNCEIPHQDAVRLKNISQLAALIIHRESVIGGSKEIIAQLPPGFALFETEVVLGFALDASMRTIAGYMLAKGGSGATSLTAQDVFVPLVRAAASAFVLAHNHPSGEPLPSPEDLLFTECVANAARVLEMSFIDHLIVGRSGIVSLRQLGLLPKSGTPMDEESPRKNQTGGKPCRAKKSL